MTEHRTPLVRADYERMQALLAAIWKDGTERAGADPLTLAHAIIPFAIERLLVFHDAATVRQICEKQVEVIEALCERIEANHAH